MNINPEDPEFLSHEDAWRKDAVVAQAVEQLICNHQVGGSNPSDSTNTLAVFKENSYKESCLEPKSLWGGADSSESECGAVGSASGLGPEGRRFESCHSDQLTTYNSKGELAQWSEQGAHNALVVGSSPSLPTNILTVEEKLAIYEEALNKISSIKSVKFDDVRNSTEGLFFLAASLRRIAVDALNKANKTSQK